MDDPISALDANVKKKIFKNVFNGELKYKTRVLVTHAVDFLHLVDRIFLFKDGQIILEGSYLQLQHNPYLKQLMAIFKSHGDHQKTVQKGVKKIIEVEDVDSDDNDMDNQNQKPDVITEMLTTSFYSFDNVSKSKRNKNKIEPKNKIVMTKNEME